MTRLRTNLIANFAGAGWSAGIQLACVPLFIKLLGVEAYGLIGFFASLQIALQALNMGLSATVNRQLARYSTLPDKAQEPRDLLHTLATGCWAIGLLLGGSIALMAPAISGSWLRADALGPSAVRDAVQMMGLIIALQWPLSVYQGGLLGLQRHVLLNVLRILSATINTGGAVLALWFFSRHVETFFLWQIVGSLLQVVDLPAACNATKPLPSGPPAAGCPRFATERKSLRAD